MSKSSGAGYPAGLPTIASPQQSVDHGHLLGGTDVHKMSGLAVLLLLNLSHPRLSALPECLELLSTLFPDDIVRLGAVGLEARAVVPDLVRARLLEVCEVGYAGDV